MQTINKSHLPQVLYLKLIHTLCLWKLELSLKQKKVNKKPTQSPSGIWFAGTYGWELRSTLEVSGLLGSRALSQAVPDSHPGTLSPSVLLSSSHSNGSLFSVWPLTLSISLGIQQIPAVYRVLCPMQRSRAMPWCVQNQPETLRRLSGGLYRRFVFINNKSLYTKLFHKRLPFQFHKITLFLFTMPVL